MSAVRTIVVGGAHPYLLEATRTESTVMHKRYPFVLIFGFGLFLPIVCRNVVMLILRFDDFPAHEKLSSEAIIALLNAIPFFVLGLLFRIRGKRSSPRFTVLWKFVLITALVSLSCLIIFIHGTIWWQLYSPGGGRSTAVILLFLAPFWGLVAMIAGGIVGGILGAIWVSLWPPRPEFCYCQHCGYYLRGLAIASVVPHKYANLLWLGVSSSL